MCSKKSKIANNPLSANKRFTSSGPSSFSAFFKTFWRKLENNSARKNIGRNPTNAQSLNKILINLMLVIALNSYNFF